MYRPRNELRIVLVVAILIWPDVTPSKSHEPVESEKPTAGSMLGKAPGDVRDDNGLEMKLVWCPLGFLTMQQVEVEKIQEPDAENAKGNIPRKVEKITPVKVSISRGYWLGKYEVTQAEWKQVIKREPWKGQRYTQKGDDFPATFISWFDAMEFCQEFTQLERKAGRLPDDWAYTLPTEAQWERACRARTETEFSFGDDVSKLSEYAWFRDNCTAAGEAYAHRVGQKKPNPWGLFDMHGNMREWCKDAYEEKLPGGRDPDVSNESKYQVSRGGGWVNPASSCRSAFRGQSIPDTRSPNYGFRVALISVQPADKTGAEPRSETSGRN